MESNKKSSEFNFYEAALVKRTALFKDCINIVVGKGNSDANILFVGEAPGRNEDEQGIPFCGAAGKNLDKLLERVGLSLDDIYVANILKCRPPMNRDPLPDEVKAHTPWLLRQIREIKPKVVCSLGNYATKFFLAGGNVDEMKNQPGITQVHGGVHEVSLRVGDGIPHKIEESSTPAIYSGSLDDKGNCSGVEFKLIPLFHPAAIIYNRTKLTPLWEEDMEVVKKVVSEMGK